jgi:hypothetical protein
VVEVFWFWRQFNFKIALTLSFSWVVWVMPTMAAATFKVPTKYRDLAPESFGSSTHP